MADLSPREQAFIKAAALLDAAEVVWWLSDGAALGCVREGRFLDSDHDMDLGCWATDLAAVRTALAGQGIGKVRRDTPGQLQLRTPGIKFDIHGHFRDGDTVWFPLGGNAEWRYRFPADLFDRFDTYKFYGCRVLVPSPPERYLSVHYGDDWRTPKGRWRWDRSPPCLEAA